MSCNISRFFFFFFLYIDTGESVPSIGRIFLGLRLDVHEDLSGAQDLHQEPERGRQEQGWPTREQ